MKTEFLGSDAVRPFLSSYALTTELKTKLLGFGAGRPCLRSYAKKIDLLGSEA